MGEVNVYSAAGCGDSDLTGSNFLLVNFCEMDENGAWSESEKWMIESDGKLKKYRWSAATGNSNKDCSGDGTEITGDEGTAILDACKHISGAWYKLGTIIDGASIPGYSTTPGAIVHVSPTNTPTNTPTTAPSMAPTTGTTTTCGEITNVYKEHNCCPSKGGSPDQTVLVPREYLLEMVSDDDDGMT